MDLLNVLQNCDGGGATETLRDMVEHMILKYGDVESWEGKENDQAKALDAFQQVVSQHPKAGKFEVGVRKSMANFFTCIESLAEAEVHVQTKGAASKEPAQTDVEDDSKHEQQEHDVLSNQAIAKLKDCIVIA